MDKTQWNERKKIIEKALVEELQEDKALDPRLCEAMKYSLTAGGKRLRPILVMAAADAIGATGTDYIHIACALEMIHTYSLIHDDLPAMDNDDYRRGKLTNHKVFGEGMAVLAGDALLTQAFEVILRQDNVPAEVLVQVVREVAIGAGPNGMGGGQSIDLEAEGHQMAMTIDDLRKMHGAKTGALFRAAVRSGAIVAGAKPEELTALTRYADCFGLAFQITDDILDVVGDEAVIGKPVGSDERNEKSTYVTLTSLDEAKKMAADAVNEAVDALSMFGDKAAFLRELVECLLNRNK
ncbi:MAG: polyprenyl synthetase family protein [Anaerovibrio sp.]|uniref:polyprenyl synthetase family protein n=1 Tax=Anaerovibrio sp. TaxID=1872532 RepID=UPI0025B91609|nr:farnesyl diphosphate synthase [Anaerovibrio sp.]MBE6099526.1 polyprenyl synthetase family protein [Anaerovibrio sp.]